MKKIFQTLKKYTSAALIITAVFITSIVFVNAAASTTSTSVSIVRFIEGSTSLVNRIGSLSIHPTLGMPTFFLSGDSSVGGSTRCINKDTLNDNNTYSNQTGKETCFNVSGGSVFGESQILNPAYFLASAGTRLVVGSSFATGNENTNDSDVFVVADANGLSNESILVDGLKRLNTTGLFVPRDNITQRYVCASGIGTLFPCTQDEPSETYLWVEGDWGECSTVSGESCSGSYTTASGGVCSGSWGEVQTTDVEMYTTSGNSSCDMVFPGWMTSAAMYMCQPIVPTPTVGTCRTAISSASCSQVLSGSTCTVNGGNGQGCSGSQGESICEWVSGACQAKPGVATHIEQMVIGSCSGTPIGGTCLHNFSQTDSCTLNETSETSCNSCNGWWWPGLPCNMWNDITGETGCTNQNGCTWTPDSSTTTQCSASNPGTSSSCTSQNGACTWTAGSTAVECSASNPGTSSSCTSQNGGSPCTWTDAGTSVSVRAVVCQNSGGTTVADSYCTTPKPPVSSDDPVLVGGNFCEVEEEIDTLTYKCTEDQQGSGGWIAYSENGDNACPPLDYPTYAQQAYDLNDVVCSSDNIEGDQCFAPSKNAYKCTEDQQGHGGWIAYSENGNNACPPLSYPTYAQQAYDLNDVVCSYDNIEGDQCYAPSQSDGQQGQDQGQDQEGQEDGNYEQEEEQEDQQDHGSDQGEGDGQEQDGGYDDYGG